MRAMPDASPNLRTLKARAQLTKASIRLGKAGLTPEFLAAFDGMLNSQQLVKLKFEDFKDERKTLSRQLAEQTNSLLVQQVGHTAVFYRAKTAAPTRPAESAEPADDSQ